MRTTIALAVTAAALAGLGTQAAAAPSASNTKVCGQIKKGPYASYLSSITGIRAKGTTWTVFGTDVACGNAMNGTRSLFTQWKRAKPGAPLSLKGYTCLKIVDRKYSGGGISSGGGVCHLGTSSGTSIFGPDTFAFRMSGKYTVGQIKALFHIK